MILRFIELTLKSAPRLRTSCRLRTLTTSQPKSAQSFAVMSGWNDYAGQHSGEYFHSHSPLTGMEDSNYCQDDIYYTSLLTDPPDNGTSESTMLYPPLEPHMNLHNGHHPCRSDASLHDPMLFSHHANALSATSLSPRHEVGNDSLNLDTSVMDMSEDESSKDLDSTIPTSLHSSDNEKLVFTKAKQQSPRVSSQSQTSDATIQVGALHQMTPTAVPTSSQIQHDLANSSSKSSSKITKAQKGQPRARGKGKIFSPRAEQEMLKTIKTESLESTPDGSPLAVRPAVQSFYREPNEGERKHLEALKNIPADVVCEWVRRIQESSARSYPVQEQHDTNRNSFLAFSVRLAACRKNGMPQYDLQTRERRWACTCCKQSYKSKWNWLRHEQSNLFDWPCPESGCPAVYPRQDKIPDHLRKCHPIPSRADVQPRPLHRSFNRHCGLCGEIFKDPTAFLDHVALHWDGKKPGPAGAFCTMEQWRWDWQEPEGEMGESDDGDDGDDGNNDDGNDGDNDQSDSNNDFDPDPNGDDWPDYYGGDGAGSGSADFTMDNFYAGAPPNQYLGFKSAAPVRHHGVILSPSRDRSHAQAKDARAASSATVPGQPGVQQKLYSQRRPRSPRFESYTRFEKFLIEGVSSREDHVDTVDNHCQSILGTFSDASVRGREKSRRSSRGIGGPENQKSLSSRSCPSCNKSFDCSAIESSDTSVCPECSTRMTPFSKSDVARVAAESTLALSDYGSHRAMERKSRQSPRRNGNMRRNQTYRGCFSSERPQEIKLAASIKARDRDSPQERRHFDSIHSRFRKEIVVKSDVAVEGMTDQVACHTDYENFRDFLCRGLSGFESNPPSKLKPLSFSCGDPVSQSVTQEMGMADDNMTSHFSFVDRSLIQGPQQAALFDPRQRMAHATACWAMEDSGLAPDYTALRPLVGYLPIAGGHRQILIRSRDKLLSSTTSSFDRVTQQSDRPSHPDICSKGDEERNLMHLLAAVLTPGPGQKLIDPRILHFYAGLLSYILSSTDSEESRFAEATSQWISTNPVSKSYTSPIVGVRQAPSLNQLLMSMHMKPTKKMKHFLEKSLSEFLGADSSQCQFVFDLSLPRFRSHLVVRGLVNGVTGQINLALQLSTRTNILSRFISSSFDRFGLGTKLMDLARNRNLNIAWTSSERESTQANKRSANLGKHYRPYHEAQQIENYLNNGGSVIIHGKAVTRPLQLLTGMCSFHLQHALPLCSNVEPVSPTALQDRPTSPTTKANLRQKLTNKMRSFSRTNKGLEQQPSKEIPLLRSRRLTQSLRKRFPKVDWRKKRCHSEIN